MRPRVHIPPCRFCAKQFQRTEHLRRHERTRGFNQYLLHANETTLTSSLLDTNEKPFTCFCDRAFHGGEFYIFSAYQFRSNLHVLIQTASQVALMVLRRWAHVVGFPQPRPVLERMGIGRRETAHQDCGLSFPQSPFNCLQCSTEN